MRTDTSLISFLNLKMSEFSGLKKGLKTDLRNSVGCCFEQDKYLALLLLHMNIA